MKHSITTAGLIDNCPLDRSTPFAILNVSYSQMSVARHFGGCVYQGKHYRYFAESDELIRDDVLKWIGVKTKLAAKSEKEKFAQMKERELF